MSIINSNLCTCCCSLFPCSFDCSEVCSPVSKWHLILTSSDGISCKYTIRRSNIYTDTWLSNPSSDHFFLQDPTDPTMVFRLLYSQQRKITMATNWRWARFNIQLIHGIKRDGKRQLQMHNICWFSISKWPIVTLVTQKTVHSYIFGITQANADWF